MQAVWVRPLAARRRALKVLVVAMASLSLACGAAFGAGVLYGRATVRIRPAPTAVAGTGTSIGPRIDIGGPVDAGHGPAGPAGGGH